MKETKVHEKTFKMTKILKVSEMWEQLLLHETKLKSSGGWRDGSVVKSKPCLSHQFSYNWPQ